MLCRYIHLSMNCFLVSPFLMLCPQLMIILSRTDLFFSLQVIILQKVLEHMLAQFSFFNFAYQVQFFSSIINKLTTPENTISYLNTLCLSPQILHKHCFQLLLGPF